MAFWYDGNKNYAETETEYISIKGDTQLIKGFDDDGCRTHGKHTA